MKKAMTISLTTRMENPAPPDFSADLSPEAPAPLAGSGLPVFVHERKGAVGSLAVSLNSLDACIDLIGEGKPAPVRQIMEQLERDIISHALIVTHANIRGAALLLGIKYSTLYAKIQKHGLRLTKAVRFCPNSSASDLEWQGRG